MVYSSDQSSAVWRLARSQHGVVTHAQLLELGYSRRAIRHRVAKGRLHPVGREVYAVGRPELTRYGLWMAAVLTCARGAVLSHDSAAALWEIRRGATHVIHLSMPVGWHCRQPGIVTHRRRAIEATRHHNIPVTTPRATLIDIALSLTRDELEAAINEADKRDLTSPDQLRSALDEVVGRPGAAVLRKALDHRTFKLTDSALERRFLRLVRRAGLPAPETGVRVNGFKVDFYWPALGLVVETDGLRYHRTPAQQATDRVRDQAHAAAGLTALRFTHSQVAFDGDHVRATLAAVASRR